MIPEKTREKRIQLMAGLQRLSSVEKEILRAMVVIVCDDQRTKDEEDQAVKHIAALIFQVEK